VRLLLPLPHGVTTGANDSTNTNTKDATMSAILNSATLEDAMNFAAECGAALAKGDDAWPTAGIGACDYAAQGVLKPEHAEAYFTKIVTAMNLTSIHGRTKNGVTANVSKLRQFINLGAKFGTDPLDDAVRLFRAIPEPDRKGAYVAYLAVARAQLTSDNLLSEDEITQLMLKGDAKPSTEEAKLKQALKAIESAEKLRADAGLSPRYELGEATTLLARALALAVNERENAEWNASRPVLRLPY
jgi:hypothetical protein